MTLMNEAPLLDTNPRLPAKHTLPAQLPPARSLAGLADLTEVLRTCGPIPRLAVFLGMALDGLPVLLNLRDPTPGPLLVVGDPGSGKRRLLQVVARSADLVHPPSDIRHVVLTDHPREWEPIGQAPSCEGILTFRHPLTIHYINSLVQSARSAAASRSYLLLLVDGLEAMASDPETRDSMKWLLQNGPARSIWPIVAVSTPRTPTLATWLEPFHTVLCGRTSGGAATSAPALEGSHRLTAGAQFAMLSGDEWLPFWVPEPL